MISQRQSLFVVFFLVEGLSIALVIVVDENDYDHELKLDYLRL